MSYFTRHTLSVLNKNFDEDTAIIRRLLEIVKSFDEDAEILMAIDEDGSCSQEVKWYNDDEDMARYSRWFPDVVFILAGEGEDNDDLWRKYFHNGKMQMVAAKITFGDFDPAKLKEVNDAWHPVKHLEEEVFDGEDK